MSAYGSNDRPHFELAEGHFWIILPQKGPDLAQRVSPDVIREMIIGGIHALQDQAYEDRSNGVRTSADMAYQWLEEAVLQEGFETHEALR